MAILKAKNYKNFKFSQSAILKIIKKKSPKNCLQMIPDNHITNKNWSKYKLFYFIRITHRRIERNFSQKIHLFKNTF